MALFSLQNPQLSLTVSSRGGVILQLLAHQANGQVPLLRPAELSDATTALQSGCFPLVPFGNRVNGNLFSFDGREYSLTANTDWDEHYLHGDGWLNPWQCLEHSASMLLLEYIHTRGPYRYLARQRFTLDGATLCVALSVTNQGAETLPFGLGWHPFFPLTGQTRLQAGAGGYWREGAQWLAGEHQTTLPEECDFNHPRPLPRHWLNNGFSGWDGTAEIDWPERRHRITLMTTPACPVYFVFVSDPAFNPGYDFEFFCFEPMSHAANGHHLPDLGGLKALDPGETLTQELAFNSISY